MNDREFDIAKAERQEANRKLIEAWQLSNKRPRDVPQKAPPDQTPLDMTQGSPDGFPAPYQ